LTATPTAWLLSRTAATAKSTTRRSRAGASLAARGVPDVLRLPRVAFYDQRFVRVPGVTLATSLALAADARAAGFVGVDGFFVTPTDDLAAVTANPSLMPRLVGLPGRQLDVIDQVQAMQAEHRCTDWATARSHSSAARSVKPPWRTTARAAAARTSGRGITTGISAACQAQPRRPY
jgi:hypothetical protein